MHGLPPDLRLQIAEAAERMEEVRASISPSLIEAAEQINAAISPALLQEITRYQRIIEERAEEKRLLDPFIENGLCLTPSMPQELVDECIQHHEANESVLDAVLAWARVDEWAALKEIAGSWKAHPLLVPRIEIIEEALALHISGRHSASVALLISQPEGVVMDWVYEAEAVNEAKKEVDGRRRERVRAEQEYEEMLEEAKATGLPADDLLVAYTAGNVTMIIGMLGATKLSKREWSSMHTFIHFSAKHLYADYKIFKHHDAFKSSNALNRHAIVHGSALGAGTEANSLRLFLALDVLALYHG